MNYEIDVMALRSLYYRYSACLLFLLLLATQYYSGILYSHMMEIMQQLNLHLLDIISIAILVENLSSANYFDRLAF